MQQGNTPRRGRMSPEEGRHLLRRLAFAATPHDVRLVNGLPPDVALTALLAHSRSAATPEPPACVRSTWHNSALRMPGTTDAEYDAARAAQVTAHRRDIELVRQWWVSEMIAGDAPLRETMVLFFDNTFGSSTEQVDIPHALHQRNAVMRRLCLESVPALLEALIVDPAMMMQIGMDGHFRARVSDRAAKLVLDHWTVGPGNYTDADVENLSRALTGWHLTAAPGDESRTPDASAALSARRTGLVPTFVPAQADTRAKTILGFNGMHDARAAIRLLARHPSTARRYSERLLRYFGVEVTDRALVADLAWTYQTTEGSVAAMLAALVQSSDFWAAASRWSLVKSPVQLAVGACRQLDLKAVPPDRLTSWLAAAGQTLFDTPNGGEGGWPGQEAWITPADRLVVRYQLPVVLAGDVPRLGVRAVEAAAPRPHVQVADAVAKASPAQLLERLDPAPGLDAATLKQAAKRAGWGTSRGQVIIHDIVTAPQYQLA